jgi:hypothetical protein
MAGSRGSSAIERRAHIIVDGIMSGILSECPALGLDRAGRLSRMGEGNMLSEIRMVPCCRRQGTFWICKAL